MTERTFKILQRVRSSSISILVSVSSAFLAVLNALKQAGIPIDKFPGVVDSQNGRWIFIILLSLVSVFLLGLRFPRFASLALRVFGREPLPSDLPRLFRGPRPYNTTDGKRFFGRRADIDEVWRRLQQDSFLILEGESGCGKSSLVQAGLLTNAKELFVVKEARVADEPFGKIFRILLSKTVSFDVIDPADFFRAMKEESHDDTTEDGSNEISKPLLLILDQFEELFTTVRDEARLRFFLFLKEGIEKGVFRLLIVIRSDFVDLLMRACRELDREQETLRIGNYYSLRSFNESQAEAVLMQLLAPVYENSIVREPMFQEFSHSLIRELLRTPRDTRVYTGDEKTVLPVEIQMVGTILEGLGPEKFSSGDLRKLGGKLGLLRIYLQNAKDYVWRQTGEAGDTTVMVLRAMRPYAVRQQFSATAIAEAVGISVVRAEAVLRTFSEIYLVKRVPDTDETSFKVCYELMHEHLLHILDAAPEPILQRERDANERLAFLTAGVRNAALPVETKRHFWGAIRSLFFQPIKISEVIKLRRFARSKDERQILRHSLYGFFARLTVVGVSIILAVSAWLWHTRRDSYQVECMLAAAPVAQTAANKSSDSSNIILDWTEAIVRANLTRQIPTIIEQIEDQGLRLEVLLAAAETCHAIGNTSEATRFFDSALTNAREFKTRSRPAAVAAVALAMKRAKLDQQADVVFDEALMLGNQAPESTREEDLALVVQTLTRADKLDKALAAALQLIDVMKRDEALGDICDAQLRLDHVESALDSALKIDNYSFRSGALAGVVTGLSEKGKTDQALLIIPRIVQDDFRYQALTDLAAGFAEQGRVDEALRTVRRIGVDDFTPSVMAEVNKARDEKRRRASYKSQTEAGIDELQTLAYIKVADGLANAGKKKEASEILDGVMAKNSESTDQEPRRLLSWLASVALIKVGDRDQARRSFAELLSFITQYKASGDSEDDEAPLYGFLVFMQILISIEDGDEAENQFTQFVEAVKTGGDEQVKFKLLSSMADILTKVLSSSPSQGVVGTLGDVDIGTLPPSEDDVVIRNRIRTMATRLINEVFLSADKIRDEKARLNAFLTVSKLSDRDGKLEEAKIALNKARQIAANLRSDSEISGALELVSEGFARLGSFREARLICDGCSSSDKLKAYTFILNQVVRPNQHTLREEDRPVRTRIAYDLS